MAHQNLLWSQWKRQTTVLTFCCSYGKLLFNQYLTSNVRLVPNPLKYKLHSESLSCLSCSSKSDKQSSLSEHSSFRRNALIIPIVWPPGSLTVIIPQLNGLLWVEISYVRGHQLNSHQITEDITSQSRSVVQAVLAVSFIVLKPRSHSVIVSGGHRDGEQQIHLVQNVGAVGLP